MDARLFDPARRRRERGFTLPELLVVLAIIGIAVAVASPLVAEYVRAAKVRAAADQFAMDLRAARMIAVAKRTNIPVVVAAHPQNYYEYPAANGEMRRIVLPSGVHITSTDTPITFRLNGAVSAPASTVFEVTLSKATVERFTVDVNVLGVPTITHERL